MFQRIPTNFKMGHIIYYQINATQLMGLAQTYFINSDY